MCLAALALGVHERFPLVVATNRDEWFERPTQPLGWWQPDEGGPWILGGRDLRAGGTWLGLSGAGRVALLTNVRDGTRPDEAAPSRGEIVPRWLAGDEAVDRFWMRTALEGHGGFNLIMGHCQTDPAAGDWYWASNRAALPRRLTQGVFGLSNAALDTPWPKVVRLRQRLSAALRAVGKRDVAWLTQRLFDALLDQRPPADDELPSTGLSLEWERWLSPAFIRTPDLRYGTRCATLIVVERRRDGLHTHVVERSYEAQGGPEKFELRHESLAAWPGRSAQPAD